MLDMHVHILPGIDDGAKDEECAVRMLDRAAALGITSMVATPHARKALDDGRDQTIEAVFSRVQALAQARGIEMALGYEVNYRALADLDNLPRRRFSLGDALLLELPGAEMLARWESLFADIQSRGLNIILAHLERYAYIQRNASLAGELRSAGCEIQIDAAALFSPLFSPARGAARRLLADGLVDYIASDAHRAEDYDGFARARLKYKDVWPEGGQLSRMMSR